MEIDWGVLLLPAAVLLLIPIAIVAGIWRSTGAIIVSAALATVAFAAFWLVLGGTASFYGNSASSYLIRVLIFFGGIVLTLATWALALNAAAQARRWVWVGLLLVAGYLTLAAVYASFSLQTCFGGPDSSFACPSPDLLRQALVFIGYLACPVAALVFGARAGRRVRTLPDGLTVSSLHAEPASSAAGAEDAEDAEDAAETR